MYIRFAVGACLGLSMWACSAFTVACLLALPVFGKKGDQLLHCLFPNSSVKRKAMRKGMLVAAPITLACVCAYWLGGFMWKFLKGDFFRWLQEEISL